MKKLTLKVSLQKDFSMVSLIKEIDKISCRINLDLEQGLVIVENVNDSMMDTVIELVNNYYVILGVEIDNTYEVTEETTKILEPQTEDDLVIKKVEFENEYIENVLNKLMRTAYWAVFQKRVTEKEIGDFIYTALSEISMRYKRNEAIDFEIGDVVDVNFGTHLIGEINGQHVPAVVCNISEKGMVYVVPITKLHSEGCDDSSVIFNVPQDITYKYDYYKGGVIILDKGRYIRTQRLNEVIGKVNPEFFKKMLEKLAKTFDFTSNI